jgi:hypothetical protein
LLSTKEPTLNPYPIDPHLYSALRRYCDANGLRFLDFLEEALDNAIRRDEILVQAAENEEALARIEQVRRKAYFRGFWCGLVAGLSAAGGNLALLNGLMPDELLQEEAAAPVPVQQQLQLFDD